MTRLQRHSGVLCLLAVAGLLSIGWLVVLPAVASRPAVSGYLQRLDDQGIDASAMFYTELEMMPKLLERRERNR